MTDEYLSKDSEGIIVLDGSRQGTDRRRDIDRRFFPPEDWYGLKDRRQERNRREPGERRTGPAFSLSDIFHENFSSFIIGIFFNLLGLCMIISGLTFLPIIGLIAGVFILIVSAWFLVKAFRSTWPSA